MICTDAVLSLWSAGLLLLLNLIAVRSRYGHCRSRPRPWKQGLTPHASSKALFYEKVVKVKADVAAILNFSLPTITTKRRWRLLGGCARGVSAERFETPLAGGAAALMCASAFCWPTACQRRGGNPPAPAFPRRVKRGRSNFLAAA